MSDRSVVVTGMSAISPAGVGVDKLWSAVAGGQSFGSSISQFEASRYASRIAAAIPDFDPLAWGLSASEVARMDRSTQFARIAGEQALRDAGAFDGVEPHRMGAIVGTAIGGVALMEKTFRQVCRYQNGTPGQVSVDPLRAPPFLYSGFLAQSVSTEVALACGCEGFTTTVATGCTAGLDAIGAAALAIRAGMIDVAITGGTDAPITPIVAAAFDVIHCLTRRNEAPARASRPFDRDRDGFLLAEGCGMLILEEEEHAWRRGAVIYAKLLGYSSLCNAYHMTSLPVDGMALAATLRRTLNAARTRPEQVDYINAHGSSTPQNDQNETSAFKQVFGARAYHIPISSTKSAIGHSLGAASALESIVCICALRDGLVPPTVNYETPCPSCDLDYVPNVAREARLRVVECNASGFSGIHSAAVFAKTC